jgi:hypothetical protein
MDGVIVSNAFGRWIIVHPENRFLAWTGSRWAAIDDLGFPSAEFQVCNFDDAVEAARYAYDHGFKLVLGTRFLAQ